MINPMFIALKDDREEWERILLSWFDYIYQSISYHSEQEIKEEEETYQIGRNYSHYYYYYIMLPANWDDSHQSL